MAQNHQHEHITGHVHNSSKNIKTAFFLNLLFTILEIIGGIWTNSMAILSDALHDLGDSVSLGGAWYLESYSKKKPDHKFSYGYARFSLLSALLNSFILVVGSVLILARSIPRIVSPEDINPLGMLLLSIIGILVNGLAVLRLRKGSSLNEKVVTWHLLEDVLGWAVLLIASIVLMFVYVPVLDTILSISITIYILINVVINIKKIMSVFLQKVPDNLSINEIEQEIEELAGVHSVHHTHIWSLEGQKNLLSIHIVVKDKTGIEEVINIKRQIRELMLKKGIDHVTIEVDYEGEDCNDQSC